ncbi:MAG: 16S rRNA (cytidine(1402)-2'-O)-methyltransferase [Candidatus Bipolaricaulota bacterium]|nr:MAG: 16S rRNA (cytidine(1402)-2'-O)-methyltransferase [Candidatus Bipolaricaulota bacterium]
MVEVERAGERRTGRLFVVSLPIGNLEDITIRALRVLRSVDRILAEDTRDTRRVLDRYRITTPFSSSIYQGVERERVEPVLRELRAGRDVALVSDAGTPLISDPGFPLVRAAVEAGISVVPVPGASALLAALVASGVPCDRFAFDGMLPRKASARTAYLQSLRSERRTVVIYESPHRLLAALETIAEILPGRRLVLARELTKLHEEFLEGTASEILEALRDRDRVRGECVLVVHGSSGSTPKIEPEVWAEIVALLREAELPRKAAARILAAAFGIARNDAYRKLGEAGDDGP